MRVELLVILLATTVAGAAAGDPGPAVTRDVMALGGVAFDGELPGQALGATATGLGDVNGDGLADIALRDIGTGSVRVIFGSRSPAGGRVGLFGTPTGRGFRISGPVGVTGPVTGVADMNGDGRRDIAIGFPSATFAGRVTAGVVDVVYTPSPARDINLALLGTDGFILAGAGAGDRAGTSLADPGDLNADGAGELLIGAPGVSTAGAANRGAAFLVQGLGTSGSFDLIPATGGTARFLGEGTGQRAGEGVAAGDVTGDGVTDLVVAGAADATGGGRVHVVSGTVRSSVDLGGLDTAKRGYAIRTGDGPPSVAVLPDQNGDGRGELLMGFGAAASGAGGAAVAYGTAQNIEVSLSGGELGGYRIDPPAGTTGFGATVASAGDQNGDGLGDLLIGGTGSAVTVVFGGARTAPVTASLLGRDGVRLTTSDDNANAPVGVAAAGDTNGDGRTDLLLGLPSASAGGVGAAGRAWLAQRVVPPPTPVPPGPAPGSGTTAFAVGGLRVRCSYPARASRVCRPRLVLRATAAGRVRIVLRRGARVVRLTLPVSAGANRIRLPVSVRGRALAAGRYSVSVTPVGGAAAAPLTARLTVRRR